MFAISDIENNPVAKRQTMQNESVSTMDVLSAAAGEGLDMSPVANESSFINLWMANHDDRSRMLTAEEANKSYGIEGALRFNQPTRVSAAMIMRDKAEESLMRQNIIGKASGWQRVGGFGVGAITPLLDPINIASMFIPVIGEERAAMLTARYGKFASRFIQGSASGAVGIAAVEPIVYLGKNYEGRDYSLSQAAYTIALGGVLSGVLHAGGGAILDRFRKPGAAPEITSPAQDLAPETHKAAVDTAISQVARDEPVNIAAILAADRPTLLREAAEDPAIAAQYPDVIDGVRAELEGRGTSVPRGTVGGQLDQGARSYDIIDEAGNHYKKISWALIKQADPNWKPVGAARKIFSATGEPADVAAQALFESGHFSGDPGSMDQFGKAMNDAALTRKNARQGKISESGKIVSEESKTVKFEKDVKIKSKTTEHVVTDDLNVGDSFTLKGKPLKVVKLEYDVDGAVTSITLEDGNDYGTQTVGGETSLRMDKGSFVSKPSVPQQTMESLRKLHAQSKFESMVGGKAGTNLEATQPLFAEDATELFDIKREAAHRAISAKADQLGEARYQELVAKTSDPTALHAADQPPANVRMRDTPQVAREDPFTNDIVTVEDKAKRVEAVEKETNDIMAEAKNAEIPPEKMKAIEAIDSELADIPKWEAAFNAAVNCVTKLKITD